MVMMTGEWSRTYPVWIEEWGISREEYSGIIEALEEATKPLAQSMWDAQQKAAMNIHVAHQKRMENLNGLMAGVASLQRVPQVIDSTLKFESNGV